MISTLHSYGGILHPTPGLADQYPLYFCGTNTVSLAGPKEATC